MTQPTKTVEETIVIGTVKGILKAKGVDTDFDEAFLLDRLSDLKKEALTTYQREQAEQYAELGGVEEVIKELEPILKWPSNKAGNENIRKLYKALTQTATKAAEEERQRVLDILEKVKIPRMSNGYFDPNAIEAIGEAIELVGGLQTKA